MNVTGEWFRWSAYDLVCGNIVPAEGAALETYDPWVPFEDNEGAYRTVEQPYVSLLRLARTLATLEGEGVNPSRCHSKNFLGEPVRGAQNAADQAILEWVNAHGLLGILPVTASEIRGPVHREQDGPGGDGSLITLSCRQHFRVSGEWFSRERRIAYIVTSDSQTSEARFSESAPPPGATVSTWHSGPKEKPPEWVREFFVPVLYGPAAKRPEPFLPPCPGTREFRATYAEPLPEFIQWTRNFHLAATTLSSTEGGDSEPARSEAEEAHWFLATLAQAAAPSFALHHARTMEVRNSAGLLASYALMFLWDRMEGRRALECGVCGKAFVSDEFRAAYCSVSCRNTASKRRARARKAEQAGA